MTRYFVEIAQTNYSAIHFLTTTCIEFYSYAPPKGLSWNDAN